jgi:hypothetical protein
LVSDVDESLSGHVASPYALEKHDFVYVFFQESLVEGLFHAGIFGF